MSMQNRNCGQQHPTSVCVAEMPCFSLQPQNAAWSHIKKLFLHWSNTTFKWRICSLFWCLSWWKTSAVKMIVWRCCWFNKVNLILCSWVEPLGANAPLKRMCFCFWNDSSDPPLRPGQSVGAHTGGFSSVRQICNKVLHRVEVCA